MPRYLIIDTENLPSTDIFFKLAIVRAKNKGLILSEGETIAKFREVYDKGKSYGIGMMMQNTEPKKENHWREVLKEL